ncbi:hypothetical protein WL29_10440 [Burkholderia ubonensis]|uniref:Uncharacterized protein n=1 Tax=Burkholderia ubonensis TaxID=101571 RepID=A0A103A6M7_9BURK|nr:hypothetical protein WI83_28670 [Burkholderia ubonensis]KWA67476.1 hypothetical protein WL29_10440 [Burkholderia ubonensis]
MKCQGRFVWPIPERGGKAQLVPMQRTILCGAECCGDCYNLVSRFDTKKSEIEKSMQVCPKQEPITDVICLWSPIGNNVRGFQDFQHTGTADCAAPSVRMKQFASEPALALPSNDSRQGFLSRIRVAMGIKCTRCFGFVLCVGYLNAQCNAARLRASPFDPKPHVFEFSLDCCRAAVEISPT